MEGSFSSPPQVSSPPRKRPRRAAAQRALESIVQVHAWERAAPNSAEVLHVEALLNAEFAAERRIKGAKISPDTPLGGACGSSDDGTVADSAEWSTCSSASGSASGSASECESCGPDSSVECEESVEE